MERKIYAPEAYELGFADGQKALIYLLKRYCNIQAENVQQLLQALGGRHA